MSRERHAKSEQQRGTQSQGQKMIPPLTFLNEMTSKQSQHCHSFSSAKSDMFWPGNVIATILLLPNIMCSINALF